MYNIFQKQMYIKHYNIIRASHGQLTSFLQWLLKLARTKLCQFKFILLTFIYLFIYLTYFGFLIL